MFYQAKRRIMFVEMLYSKIHRAKVSDANLHYRGSISIDEKLMKAANLLPGQRVSIVNINNGERFDTYVIKGGDGCICLNGAAARKACVGDLIIIIAYASMDLKEAREFSPAIVHVDENNQLVC